MIVYAIISLMEVVVDKIDIKETFINLKKTWKYTKNKRKPLFAYLFTSIILSGISAIIPILTAQLLLNLTNGNFNQLLFLAGIVFMVENVNNVTHFFSNKASNIFFREMLIDLQLAVAKETIKLETSVIDKETSGTFIDRLNKDAFDIANMFNWIAYCLSDVLSNIGILVAIFILSKEMFVFFILSLLVLFIFKWLQWQKFFIRDKKYRELSEKNTGLITELVRGIRDIKLLNITDTFTKKVFDKLKRSNQERYAMINITTRYNLIAGTVQDIISFLFIVYGIFLVSNNNLTIASFIILYMYQSEVYYLLSILSSFLENTKKFNLSAQRVFDITDSNKYAKEQFGESTLSKIKGDFEFNNVYFSYNLDNSVIKGLTFKVKANETVAFVGRSGSGKSTIFSLLTKLYDVNEGNILIDGINIKDLTLDSIRGNISIITQNPYIFNFSIRENLNIVKENLTDEEMIKACKLACIHDFIMTLPEKYETIVGEGGITLSGGQRQRLAIARSLIKKTEIILFDEATSSLDNETQKSIQEAINNMKKDYTILIIAHRLSTIMNCDRIIVIDDGRAIAEGTHKELLQKCDIYKKLYETELIANDIKLLS